MRRKKLVVLGLLGTTLDTGRGEGRWGKWRPTVSIGQHDDLLVDRLDLLHGTASTALAEAVAKDLAHVSPETRVARHVVDFGDPWDFEAVYAALFDFARAYPFDPEREDYLVHITTGTHVAQICLFLLAESRHLPARLLQTSPTRREGGPRAAGSYAIIDLDLSRYDRIASRVRREEDEGQSLLKAGIPTRNAAYNRLIERVEQVALASRAPILLAGPTGVGKTALAKRIFELRKARRRLKGDLAEVNCATLRGDAAMSALFGHVRGAFTGATSDRAGLLARADGGMLFLDEVGELGLDEQAMLLRAVEEKRFRPMGADREVTSDFQLVCGTNRDLAGEVRRGAFREDLLARIDLWTFRLPALCDRPEDLEPNLDFELDEASRRLGTRVTLSREARARFLAFARAHAWPGNFRDFDAAVTRMATLATGGRITERVVDEEIERLAARGAPAPAADAVGALLDRVLGADEARALDRFDRAQLADVVAACREAPTLSAAGRALFASSRARKTSVNDADRLRKYLARFGLDFAGVRGA